MEIQSKRLESEYGEKYMELFGEQDVVEVIPSGVIVPPSYMDVAQRIRDLEVRPDDVWLVSYPRTGSTWTQEMVWCIGNDLDFEGAKVIQAVRAPVIELTYLLGNDTTGVTSLLGDTLDIVEKMPSPRFIKTHLPWELLPHQLATVKPKIVYVCRNPKDMCVSFYHYCRLLHDLYGPFNTFCELFLNGKAPMGPIWNHIIGFWKLQNEPNILFLRYEEMKKDLRSVILRTAKFLDKTMSEDGIKSLMDYLSFENMRKNQAVNLEPLLEYRRSVMEARDDEKLKKMKNDDEPLTFIRKGQVGDWANHMTPEMAKRFDEWTSKNLEGTGLSFDV